MSDFKPGEHVDITIKGARVVDVTKLGESELGVTLDCDSGLYPLTVPLGPPEVTVERCDPEWWPPRPGDLLRYFSVRLFAVARGSNVWLISAYHGDDEISPQQAWEKRHQLSLVHREDEQDGGRA